jgi:sulfur carrier protein
MPDPTFPITLNGDATHASPDSTLSDLLRASGRDPEKPGIAVAVNEKVVPRSKWDETSIERGDRIEVLTALAGG